MRNLMQIRFFSISHLSRYCLPKRQTLKLLFLIIPVFLILCIPAQGEFYKYKDENGNWVFVDHIDKVPPAYLNRIDTLKGAYDHLGEDEKKRRQALDREKEIAAKKALDAEIESMRKEMIEEEKRAYEAKRKALFEKSSTPVIIKQNQVLVPVTLMVKGIQRKTYFLLDTGAGHIVIHEALANELDIDKKAKGKSIVAGGGRILSFLGYADEVRVGPVAMKNAPLLIIRHSGSSTNFTGLLGMNFLKHVKYRIDFENRLILWDP